MDVVSVTGEVFGSRKYLEEVGWMDGSDPSKSGLKKFIFFTQTEV